VIGKRLGNYTLPNGNKLSDYVWNLVDQQLRLDVIGIRENEDLCHITENLNSDGTYKKLDDSRFYVLMPDYQANEYCSYNEHEKRVDQLVREIVGF
jgi:hypothetical protein